MLVVVLVLMLVGFGVLVVVSYTGAVMWAWASVAASVVAAVLLVMSWRQRAAMGIDEYPAQTAVAYPSAAYPPAAVAAYPAAAHKVERPPAQWREEPITEAVQPVRRAVPEPPAKPGEERAEPSHLALVATLDRQVLVVDQQPRYHLAGCPVLSGLPAVGLPVNEAVALEFTPCDVCTPVRVLASAASTPEHHTGKRP